jgi:S1-C subfamily serine protease
MFATPLLASLALVAGCGGAGPPAGSSATTSPTAHSIQTEFVDVVKTVSPSVVQIQTSTGLGSGIVYDNRGNVVTNNHVVAGAKQFTVTLLGGKQVPATLVGADASNDLAVIHLTGATPPPATFADSSKVSVGYLALAIGNPLGLKSSVTMGIVSSVNRTVSEGNGVTLSSAIQTSAEINPGNSGGALVDLTGQVIGVPTLAALDPQLGNSQAPGIGFAIASNRVTGVARSLIAGGSGTLLGWGPAGPPSQQNSNTTPIVSR